MTHDIMREMLDNRTPQIRITQPSGLDYIAAAIVVRAAREGRAERQLRDVIERGHNGDNKRNDQKIA